MITSKINSRIKQIRSLRHRKDRDASGLFWVEGIRIVSEATELAAPVVEYVVAPALLTSEHGQRVDATLRDRGVPRLEVSAEVFATLSGKEGPQGIGAVIKQRWITLADVRMEGIGWVALDRVQDPGNLGTILRTTDAVAAPGVILLGHTTDPYDPTAVRASMGAIFAQNLVRADFASLIAWKQAEQYPLIGTSDSAETLYDSVTYSVPVVLLMGSEQHGLSPDEQRACDLVVRIPMSGRSDSLNLAVATGVMLYEMYRQERQSAGRREPGQAT